MKFILFTLSIFVLGCSAKTSSPVDQFQQIQQEVEQLKRSNEESIAALKRTYDEKIKTYDEKIRTYDDKIRTYDDKIRRNDEKIASLEEQLRWKTNLVSQSGPCLLIFVVFCQRQRRYRKVSFKSPNF